MKKDTIVGVFTIEYPDSFEKMEQDEIRKFYTTAANRWGIINREQHMVISVGWTKALGMIGSLLVDERSFLNRFDKHGKRYLKEYARTEDITKEFCGMTAKGFGFRYTASDRPADMRGKVVTFRIGSRVFCADYMTSNTDTLFCNMAYDMVLHSIQAVKE